MLHAVGREQGKTMVLRQVDQSAIDALFAPHEMALQFDINAIATKSVEQPLRAIVELRVARVAAFASPGGLVVRVLDRETSCERCDAAEKSAINPSENSLSSA